jgi:hypothetical protein
MATDEGSIDESVQGADQTMLKEIAHSVSTMNHGPIVLAERGTPNAERKRYTPQNPVARSAKYLMSMGNIHFLCYGFQKR